MHTTLTPSRKEKGSVLVLTALSLFVLMGVAGLAIDLSHAEVNKTRLQNLADALALSAAISLNKQNDPTTNADEIAAEAYARANTLALFKNSTGNAEINTAIESPTSPLDFEFTFANITDLNASTTGDWKTANAINDANFVRVTSLNTPMNISTWFAAVIGFNNMAVSNSAVAGFTPIAPCDLAPIMLCANDPVDKDCSDGECYGYKLNNIYCLTPGIGGGSGVKCEASSNSEWGPGNVGFVNLGSVFPDLNQGAQTLGQCLAGDPSCQNFCLYSPDLSQLPSKTGLNWGPVDTGIKSLFNDTNNPQYTSPSDTITGLTANGPITNSASQSSTLTYLGWAKISTFATQVPITGLNPSTFPSTIPSPFAVYQTFLPPKIETNVPSTSEYGKRVINVPFVDCANPPNGSSGTNPVVGFGCFFLTAEAEHGSSEDFILGQFINDPNLCQSTGKTTSTGNSGFDKVILYKDPFGGHS